MNCSYTLTQSELVKAMQVHGKGTKRTRVVLALVFFGLVLLGAFTQFTVLCLGAAVGGTIGYFSVLFLVIPFNARKQYNQNRGLRSEMTAQISEDVVYFKAHTGESKLQWNDIHKWKYGGGMYLLYITSNMFHMVPTRAVENKNELDQLLSRSVGPNKA